MLEQHRNNGHFVGSILYTDDAELTRNNVINSYNLHLWADEN